MRQIIGKVSSLAILAFASGVTDRLPVDRDFFYTGAVIEVEATISNSGTAPAELKRAGVMNIIKKLSLVINDKIKPLDSLSGSDLLDLCTYDFGRNPGGYAAPDMAANAVTNVRLRIPISAYLENTVQRYTTAWDFTEDAQNPELFRKIEFVITSGSINDIYGTPNGATLTNITIGRRMYWTDLEAKQQSHIRAPLRYVVSQEMDIPNSTEQEFLFENVNNRTYVGAILTILDNGESGTFRDGKTITLEHAKEEIIDDVPPDVLRDDITRSRDWGFPLDTLPLDLTKEFNADFGLHGLSMREDTKLKFFPTYAAGVSARFISIHKQPWDFR